MKEDLADKIGKTKILVGVCGAVAAMGTPHGLLWAKTRLGLRQSRVILTPMATSMFGRASFEAAVDGPVFTDWADLEACAAPHIRLANWPDVILVLPATANILAKVAGGVADSLLSTVLLAASCPVVFAPATNPAIWRKPSVQRNVEQLQADGYSVIQPGGGLSLASGANEDAGSIEDVRRPFLVALSKVIDGLDSSADFNSGDLPTKAGS